MNRFCIAEKNNKKHHAGSKARNDVVAIFEKNGYKPIYVRESDQKGTLDKLYMCTVTWRDWRRVEKSTAPGDILVIQYPLAMYPKVRQAAMPALKKMKKKGVRIILLIHDIESLRGLSFPSEQQFFDLADEIIVHNERMKQYLVEKGYSFKRIYILGVFDYLIEETGSKTEKDRLAVAIAGNLNSEKCGYIQQIPKLEKGVSYHLFGPNYQEKQKSPNMKFIGDFSPEELPHAMEEGWGLVWDGSSIETCSGIYGEYLKYNDPHKLSLYLACGIPVIVWEKSALADWVEENNLGICVGNLAEANRKILHLSDWDYREMAESVLKVGEGIEKGEMLTKVIREIEQAGK